MMSGRRPWMSHAVGYTVNRHVKGSFAGQSAIFNCGAKLYTLYGRLAARWRYLENSTDHNVESVGPENVNVSLQWKSKWPACFTFEWYLKMLKQWYRFQK